MENNLCHYSLRTNGKQRTGDLKPIRRRKGSKRNQLDSFSSESLSSPSPLKEQRTRQRKRSSHSVDEKLLEPRKSLLKEMETTSTEADASRSSRKKPQLKKQKAVIVESPDLTASSKCKTVTRSKKSVTKSVSNSSFLDEVKKEIFLKDVGELQTPKPATPRKKWQLPSRISEADVTFLMKEAMCNESETSTPIIPHEQITDVNVLSKQTLSVNKISDAPSDGTFELDRTVNDVDRLRRDSMKITDQTQSELRKTRQSVRFADGFLDSANVNMRKRAGRKSSLKTGPEIVSVPQATSNKLPTKAVQPFVKESIGARIQKQTALKNDFKNRSLPVKKTIVKHKEMSKTCVKPTFRTKMPNFALIHQKSDKKLENLQEFVARKHERAKLLLSGLKPGTSTFKKEKPSTPPRGNTKKQLCFAQSPPQTASEDVFCTPVRQPVSRLTGKTPTPFNSVKNRVATPGVEVMSNRNVQKVNSKIPIKKHAAVAIADKKEKPVMIKENPKVLIQTVDKKEKPMIKKENRKVLIEIVANKKAALKSNINTRREHIKGVRSNRRFDLLMQMRHH